MNRSNIRISLWSKTGESIEMPEYISRGIEELCDGDGYIHIDKAYIEISETSWDSEELVEFSKKYPERIFEIIEEMDTRTCVYVSNGKIQLIETDCYHEEFCLDPNTVYCNIRKRLFDWSPSLFIDNSRMKPIPVGDESFVVVLSGGWLSIGKYDPSAGWNLDGVKYWKRI